MQFENPAGQPDTGKWFSSITSEGGQEQRTSSKGVEFWCMKLQARQTNWDFRQGIQNKRVSLILASTNLSKLRGIDNGAEVVYKGSRYEIQYAQLDEVKGTMTLALK